MNEIEVFPVVLKVTAYAVFAVGILHLQTGVVAVLASQGPGDFFVAFKALEGRRAGSKRVAATALRSSRLRGMRFR